MLTTVTRVWFSSLFVCMLIHMMSQKTDAARITKLDLQMFHDESWKPIYFGV